MSLEAIYKAADAIPEQYRELYSERNGQFELTGIAGVKTQADVERVQVGLVKEREEHKATKARLALFGEMDPEEMQKKLDRIPELEAAAKEGGIDEEKMNQLVEGRLKTRLAPVERENAKLKEQVVAAEALIGDFKQKETKRSIHDEVRKALVEGKVLEVAHEDALSLAERVFEVRADDNQIVTRDNVGVTPGILAKDWLNELQPKRPHWWAPSQGGGAGGSGTGLQAHGGKNPWSKDSWNLTEQGRIVKEVGVEKAGVIARQAGSQVGAVAPPSK